MWQGRDVLFHIKWTHYLQTDSCSDQFFSQLSIQIFFIQNNLYMYAMIADQQCVLFLTIKWSIAFFSVAVIKAGW